ncbi:hypothetical protein [Burkholderia ubonensis]|uniref:hypothetical protein n=1 Tax=Burkholderia ubonensis TaxID=101571 RepID=UPI0012F9AF95|nr:hypothetical protein [Burkholderia ubonensis]
MVVKFSRDFYRDLKVIFRGACGITGVVVDRSVNNENAGEHMKHMSTPIVSALVVTAIVQPQYVQAQLYEAVTKATTITEIKGIIDSTIDKATNAGNFLVLKAATEAKSVIDTWVEGSKALLDVAFDRLNDSQRQFFANNNFSGDFRAQGHLF